MLPTGFFNKQNFLKFIYPTGAIVSLVAITVSNSSLKNIKEISKKYLYYKLHIQLKIVLFYWY